MINFFWGFFLAKERILSLKLSIRAKSTPWETYHVCKTLKLLVNFTINTTYRRVISVVLRLLSYFFEKSGRDGKNCFFLFVISRRKANWIMKKSFPGSFLAGQIFHYFLIYKHSYTTLESVPCVGHVTKLKKN